MRNTIHKKHYGLAAVIDFKNVFDTAGHNRPNKKTK